MSSHEKYFWPARIRFERFSTSVNPNLSTGLKFVQTFFPLSYYFSSKFLIQIFTTAQIHPLILKIFLKNFLRYAVTQLALDYVHLLQ